MRYTFLIISIILFLSCNSNDKNDVKTEEEIEQDFDDAFRNDEYFEKLSAFKKLREEKFFDFVCTEDCDGSDLFFNYDLNKLHDKRDHLIISKNITKDTISIEFYILSSCCQEFAGDYDLKNDTLYVRYYNILGVECACLCKYVYRIDIKNEGKIINVININGKPAVDDVNLVNLINSADIYEESKLFQRTSDFKVRGLKKAVYEHHNEEDTSGCKNWNLSEKDIQKIIKESDPISRNEWGVYFEHWDCMYKGKIQQNNKYFNFEINAGGWFTIFEKDTFFRFGNFKKENDRYFLSEPFLRRKTENNQ